MSLSTRERLNQIEQTIINDPFFGNRSLSSGNGGYIFDYNPEDEIIVRDFIRNFASRADLGFKIQAIDLFNDVLIKYLKEEGYLESVFGLEEECRNLSEGIDYLKHAMSSLIQQGGDSDLFVSYISEVAEKGNVIFLYGVGKCHPFIRSHMIINNFNSKMNSVKTILFYPGTYNSEELKLFGTISSENYYRSMVLVGRD